MIASSQNQAKKKTFSFLPAKQHKKNSFPFVMASLAATLVSVISLESYKIAKVNGSTCSLDPSNSQITLRDSNWINAMKTSNNGETLVTGNQHGLMQIWNLNNCQIAKIKAHDDAISAIAIDPNNKIIATSSRDNTIKLWDLEGNSIATFSGHKDDIESIAFAPNSKVLASGSTDRTVRLWDVETGKEIANFQAVAPVMEVNFINNSNKILAREKNDRISILEMPILNQEKAGI